MTESKSLSGVVDDTVVEGVLGSGWAWIGVGVAKLLLLLGDDWMDGMGGCVLICWGDGVVWELRSGSSGF